VGRASGDVGLLEPQPLSSNAAMRAGVPRRESDMTAPYVDVTDG
jgi:hypothetical protein